MEQQHKRVQQLTLAVPALELTLQRMIALGAQIRTVLDIGACKGDWTRAARRVLTNAEFTLVEPLDYAELHADDMLNCTVHHALLYSSDCEVDWFSLKNTGDSIYKERTVAYDGVAAERRRATTLQALLGDESHAGAAYDLIKVDVQGAELDVLRGGESLVKRASFVLLELPFMGQYNAQAPSFLEVVAYMDSLGFVPLDVVELHRESLVLLQMDVMFVKRGHAVAAQCQRAIESYAVVT